MVPLGVGVGVGVSVGLCLAPGSQGLQAGTRCRRTRHEQGAVLPTPFTLAPSRVQAGQRQGTRSRASRATLARVGGSVFLCWCACSSERNWRNQGGRARMDRRRAARPQEWGTRMKAPTWSQLRRVGQVPKSNPARSRGKIKQISQLMPVVCSV